jgi:hypothetical protein
LAGLFRAEQAPEALPQALRPAVEVIARLSAERKRLREELARLKGELTQVRGLARQAAALKQERDALAAQVARLQERAAADERRERRMASKAEARPSGWERLLKRLERAVDRIEASGAEPRPAQLAETPPEAPRRSARSRANSGRSARATPALRGPAPRRPNRGGGMLANLIQANVELRSEANARPEPQPTQSPTTSSRGGGLLGGLVRQNLSLRGPGTPTTRRDLRA